MQSGRRRGSSFLVAIALLVGVALGFCSGVTTSTTPEQAKTEREKTVKRPLADAGEAASVKALRARIAALERQLADAKAKPKPATNEVEKIAAQDGPRPPRGGGSREWLENMKKNDPVRYVQMTNRFEQFRRRRAERQQRNLDFLSSVDTSRMSASAKKTHAALQEAIALREQLEAKMHQEDLSDAERRSLFEQMRESEHELRSLRRAERDNLFEATANTLGFEGDDAKEIVDTLKEVIESTESSWRHMGPPPGSPPPPQN